MTCRSATDHHQGVACHHPQPADRSKSICLLPLDSVSEIDCAVNLQCAVRCCHLCKGILHTLQCMSTGTATSNVNAMSMNMLQPQLTLAQGLQAQHFSELEVWTVERSAHQSQLGRRLLHWKQAPGEVSHTL